MNVVSENISRCRQVAFPQASARAKVILSVVIPAFLVSCGGAPEVNLPPRDPISIKLTNPNAEPQCGCANSQGAYAQNSSDNPRSFTWTVSTRDTLSGETLKPIYGSGNVPANGRVFLGCTIHAQATNCRFQASYNKGNSLAVREIPAEKIAVYGNQSTPSIASCTAWCSNPDHPNAGACLERGVSDFQVIAPVRDLVLAAQGGSGTVSKSDLLKKYNLEASDDKCGRGDISVSNGKVINEGADLPAGEVCVVRTADLSAAARRFLKLAGPSDMASIIPKRLEGKAVSDIKALDATKAIVFEQNQYAPEIIFEGIASEELTATFGGAIVGSAQISRAGQRPQTVIATANGCIAVDEP